MTGGAQTHETERIADEDTRNWISAICYFLIGLFAAIASWLAGNGDAAEYGAYHDDPAAQHGDNPAHAAFAVLSAFSFVGGCLALFTPWGTWSTSPPGVSPSWTNSPFGIPGPPGKFHRFVFPCITLYAVIALSEYVSQDAKVADTKTNADDFWDDGHSFADDGYNPDEAALGMCWTTAILAVVTSCCFCCFCFCWPS